MSLPTYPQLIAELFPRLTGGVHWGLQRTRRLLAAVGDPHLTYRVVHIGGTNGKGSVAAHVEGILRASGRRTGLYSSPHLCTFRERVRIDGAAIAEAALLDAAHDLWPSILEEQATFFEATTAIAFLALARAGVDTAIVEVGLGGRLDATNVVEPDVAVITNISLDHVQLLGPTLSHVAAEKAGIIKAGVPLVLGETGSPAMDVILDAAAAVAAPVRVVDTGMVTVDSTGVGGTVFHVRGARRDSLTLTTPLIGRHQAVNAALAVHAVECLGDPKVSDEALLEGMRAVRWPGRLQVVQLQGVAWIFDVAHNVAGVETLCSALAALDVRRPCVAVVGVLGDKDWQRMLAPVAALADTLILTQPPTAPPERRWDPHVARSDVSGDCRVEADFTRALELAARLAAPSGGTVLVTGSFHTVGDALTALDLCPDGSDTAVRAPVLTLPGPADRV